MTGLKVVFAVAAFAALISSAQQSNVRSICETDADCPAGSRCKTLASGPSAGTSILSLLQGLIGGTSATSAQTSSTRTCVHEPPFVNDNADTTTEKSSSQQHQQQSASSIDQSASESVLRDTENWERGVYCKQFNATVPIGASLAIGIDPGTFFETNFTASNVEIAVIESRTRKALTRNSRFTFSCDVAGDFLLYFNVALRDKVSRELLDDSHICPAAIHCGDSALQAAATATAPIGAANVSISGDGSAVPTITCYDSPVALNTDREVTIGLENVAFALQMTDQVTGETIDKSAASLVTMIQHLYIPMNSTAGEIGSGTALKFKCASAGKHIVYIIISAMDRTSGAHEMKICPTTIQCNTASLTANLPLLVPTLLPSTSTQATQTIALSTTSAQNSSATAAATPDEASHTLLGAAAIATSSEEHSALFNNITDTFSETLLSAVLLNQVGATDQLEKLLFNRTN